MSRSIHETRRSLRRANRFDYSDGEHKLVVMEKAREALWKKRRIKAATERERHAPAPPEMPPLRPHLVPVVVRDEAPGVFFGASAQDVRAVLQLLPLAASEGLLEVVLCLGGEEMEESDDPGLVRDPVFGRLSFEIAPGFYSPPLLGTYASWSSRIELYACVLVPGSEAPPSMAIILRLRALQVLAHEVAHHHDYLHRKGRGRWRCDDTDKKESYAMRMERKWTREIVAPYLERTYPEEWAAL